MIWEIKRLNLLQNGNTSLAGTQEGGYSAFLKADYILGLIASLPPNNGKSSWWAATACDFYASCMRSLGVSSLGRVLSPSGLRFFLGFCSTTLSIYVFVFMFTDPLLSDGSCRFRRLLQDTCREKAGEGRRRAQWLLFVRLCLFIWEGTPSEAFMSVLIGQRWSCPRAYVVEEGKETDPACRLNCQQWAKFVLEYPSLALGLSPLRSP